MFGKLSTPLVCLSCLVFSSAVVSADDDHGPAQVIQEEKHDVSPKLRDMGPFWFNAGPVHIRPLRFPGAQAHGSQTDPVVQSGPTAKLAPSTANNFAGVGLGDYGFVPNAAPPDPNGAVGATQYVQWVNESYAVFDKATGALLLGPVPGNLLWKGFGGGCENNNDGDPLAQYDKLANRWVMTQFSVTNGPPFYQCVAVSTTSDATGSPELCSAPQGRRSPVGEGPTQIVVGWI